MVKTNSKHLKEDKTIKERYVYRKEAREGKQKSRGADKKSSQPLTCPIVTKTGHGGEREGVSLPILPTNKMFTPRHLHWLALTMSRDIHSFDRDKWNTGREQGKFRQASWTNILSPTVLREQHTCHWE